MYFKGTIVITDPCYLTAEEKEFNSNNMITADTIYGDWICTVYHTDVDGKINPDLKSLGTFTSDTGRVCVCLLDEVLEFNSNLAKWMLEHHWCVTIIPNYNGEVTIEEINKSVHVIGKNKFISIQTA